MKAKKVILAIATIFAMIACIIGTTYAAGTNKYVPVTLALNTKHDGDVYINTAIGYGTGGGHGQLIYKIYSPDGGFNKTVYCIRGGPGFGSSDWNAGNSSSPTSSVTYTKEFDLKRALIDSTEIPAAYRTAIPAIGSDTYKKLLWVLDHLYVPEAPNASETRKGLLKAAGLLDYDNNHNILFETELSDANIDVIQQNAIWYFTNYGDEDYSSDNINLTLNGASLGDIDSALDQDAYNLYRYFIDGANAHYQDYEVELDESGNVRAVTPYRFKKTSPTIVTEGKFKYVGPYRLIKSGDLLANHSFTFKNGEDKVTAVIYVKNASGNFVVPTGYEDIVDDVMVEQDFYLKVDKDVDVSNLTVKQETTYVNAIAKYLSVDASTHNLANEQPVVVVDQEILTSESSINLHQEKEFDLSLRKSITKIGDAAPTVNRLPQIDTTKLDNETDTTAKYNHTKEALEVETDQYIEYTINVYNEGQKNGYASEIKDYLPDGIEYVELVNSPNYSAVANKQADGTTIVTITNTGRTVLEAYKGDGTPSNESFTMRCKITKTAGAENIRLVNIAEISKYYDSELGREVTEDRDSQPGNFPDSKKNNNYVGNGSDGSYVKGQQDDDDFEPVILKGKEFDLALRKFIIGVNDTELKNTDGTYTREPKVDTAGLLQGYQADKNDPNRITTATYNHPKTPVAVSTGDIVTYVIRVYNEGKVDGYAKEITDHLPPELEFLPTDSTNQEYGWALDTSDPTNRTIKTTYLADKLIEKYANGTTLDHEDLKIRCKVKENIEAGKKITNIADITEFADKDGNPVTDRDSQKDNVTLPTDETLPEYSDHQQDDDDYEKIITKYFDLALRKSITKINNVAPAINRLPEVETTNLANGTDTTATYNHPKNDLETSTGQYIEYTLTVYNEGQKNGYAAEIKDYLPAGIEYVELVNSPNYSATAQKQENGTTIITITNNAKTVLNAYDGTRTLSQEAVTIKCQVTAEESTADQRFVNIAEITKYFDSELGKEVAKDRDSEPANFPDGQKNNNYNGKETVGEYVKGQQDDDDFEPVVLKAKYFDLALRKFIIGVNDTIYLKEGRQEFDWTTMTPMESAVPARGTRGEYERAPQVDTSTLLNGGTTATYNHTKAPITIKPGDEVYYMIRVYNEGQINGIVKEITDHLPKELEFLPEDAFNQYFGWKLDETDTTNRTVKTNYLRNTTITKYTGGNTLAYAEVPIKCRVKPELAANTKITNIADITDFTDGDGKPVTDRDSQKDNVDLPSDTDLPNYKDDELGKDYIPGQQDDDDFEKLITDYFDLSLRKFIAGINDEILGEPVAMPEAMTEKASEGRGIVEEVSQEHFAQGASRIQYTREPRVDTTPLKTGSGTTAIYNHPKDPLEVRVGDIVTYIIRIYNEGNIDGYVSEITDHLPPQLEFLPDDPVNIQYLWKYAENGDLRTVTTDYLKRNGIDEENIIKAYNKEYDELYYVQIPIRCKVIKGNDKKITNIADITDFTDGNGNIITDRDSQEDNVQLPEDPKLPYYKDEEINRLDTYIPGQQDDDDFEKVYIRDFDLALRKFITEVNDTIITNRRPVFSIDEDGNYIYTHTKEPVSVETTDIVTYTLRIFNEGEQAGYASLIRDDIPEGLEFLPDHATNTEYRWDMIDASGNVTHDVSKAVSIQTDYLSKEQETTPKGNLLQPFDKENMEEPDHKDVKVAFKVIAPATSKDIIINQAQIAEDTDEDGKPVDDKDSTPDVWNEGEDDQDIEKIILKYFDLALRKFITGVNDTSITNREPVFSIDENGKYIYTHTKDPVSVETTDIVTYTLRIFNEGERAGYASLIRDDIPDGLEFLPDHPTNTEYLWDMIDASGNVTDDVSKAVSIQTDYLSKEREATPNGNLLQPFDKGTMQEPDHKDVKVAFKVIAPATSKDIIINQAQIAEDTDKDGKPVDDKDSTPDIWNEGEDDQDIEKVTLKYFDLALRKFITAVDATEITNRYPKFSIDENGNYIYTHTKEPVEVENGNIVTYTLRIYNEGTQAGYATQVKDDIPDGLEFLPDHATNTEYRWEMLDEKGNKTEDITKAVAIQTDYLSKAQADATGRNNLLQPFNKEAMEEPDFRDIKIAFKVTEPNTSDRILINYAQIAEDEDENGKPVVDIDSTPDKWIDKDDDQDIDKVKVKYFDLSLRKWVTQAIITEKGETTVIESGHTAEDDPEAVLKVDLHRRKLNTLKVQFKYNIRVKNEGEIAGYATEVKDYVPEGLQFVAEDNPLWKEISPNVIVTDQLKDTLLQPGETATVEVLLTWINGEDNLGLKTNIAEISQDKNDSNTPDIDSTPDNQKEDEDDIDDAEVTLSIITGAIAGHIGLISIVVIMLAGGVILIKKYVI